MALQGLHFRRDRTRLSAGGCGQEEGRVVDVATIFDLRTRGSRWSVIIVTINVHPNPNGLVIIVNTGGQAVVLVNCKYFKKYKDCKKPKKPKKK